jgi:hypothetical protein
MQSKRIYIVLNKGSGTVLQRARLERATPEYHHETPSEAWAAKARSTHEGGMKISPANYAIVGGDVVHDDVDANGAYGVTLDWNDVHEAANVPWSPEPLGQ